MKRNRKVRSAAELARAKAYAAGCAAYDAAVMAMREPGYSGPLPLDAFAKACNEAARAAYKDC